MIMKVLEPAYIDDVYKSYWNHKYNKQKLEQHNSMTDRNYTKRSTWVVFPHIHRRGYNWPT